MDKKRGLFQNKSGQGLSTNAIILIILGVVVLVILVIGFMIGWGQLKDKLFKTNNVDTIVKSCETACTTSSQYEFCSEKRELKAEDVKLKDVTCYYLSKEQVSYGINTCDSVTCDVVFNECVPGKSLQTFNLSTNTLGVPSLC